MTFKVWTASLGTVALGLSASILSAAPAQAAQNTYDLSINATALSVEGQKIKLKVTGVMIFDDVTGEVSFTATEPEGVMLRGAGLLSTGKLAIGQTTLQGLAGETPVFNGTAFFNGKFKKAGDSFSGKFYAVADSFGMAPNGFTFNTGKVSAKRRPLNTGVR